MTSAPAGSLGYGQMDPQDWGGEFNKVAFTIRQMIAEMDTMKLVQVHAVHGGGGAIAAAGTVDVQLLVSQIDGQGNVTPNGIVYGIPWWRLQGGSNALICDPVVGDIGYVVCADRDSSGVVASPGTAAPGSSRQYNVADGIYVGGCLNGVPTQFIAFTPLGITMTDLNGNSLALGAGGITMTDAFGNVMSFASGGLKITSSNGSVINMGGASGFAFTGNLAVTGSITATAGITAGLGGGDQVGLQTHVHSANNTPPTAGT